MVGFTHKCRKITKYSYIKCYCTVYKYSVILFFLCFSSWNMRVLGHFQDYPPQSHKHFYLSYKFNYLTENPRWMLHPNSRTLSKSKMAAASLFGFSSLTTLPKTADHTFAESLPKACRIFFVPCRTPAEYFSRFHCFIVSLPVSGSSNV